MARPGRRRRGWDLPEVRWAAAATVLLLAAVGMQPLEPPTWVGWVLHAGCYVIGGWRPAIAGLQALRNTTLDVDLLMVAAALGAAAIGQLFDGGLLIVIFATSGALEAVATHRTAESVRALLELAPEQATRLGPDEGEQQVNVADLAVGDLVLARTGERVAVDGRVIGGASEVDQASITGESLPVDKTTGAEVRAGTVNGHGLLRIEVTRPASESVVAHIAALVEQASSEKARTQRFTEHIEQRYSLGVVIATIGLVLVLLVPGQPLQTAAEG